MSNNRDQIGAPGAPLVSTIGEAAAAIATAVTEYLGRTLEASGERALTEFARNANLGSQPGSAADPIAQTFNQYRDALGDLAVALPQLAQRASLLGQAEPGMRLLFRAGRRGVDGPPGERLHKVFAALPSATAQITRPVYDKVEKGRETDLSGLLTVIETQLRDERRRDLPSWVEQLKHKIRADRAKGLDLARRELGWLLDSKLDMAYALLDDLDGVLGGNCLREILRDQVGFTAFRKAVTGAPPKPPDWLDPLRDCFRQLGFGLGDGLTLLPPVSGESKEYALLDHSRDRVFRIWQGGDGKLEVYGETEGVEYFDRSATLRPSDVPRLLPHRVQDASSGMAVWGVDRRDVQDLLDGRYRTDARLFAWDMGANRTPLTLFAVHYRQSDLGEYFELGIGCFVHPARDPLAVGMLVLDDLPVSTAISCEVGKHIWGYPKVFDSKVEWTPPSYRPDRVDWSVTLASGLKVDVTLPRGGTRSSVRVPLLSYTLKHGQLYRSVLSRSGSGESLRVGGGGVAIRVSHISDEPWTSVRGSAAGLPGLLQRFSLVSDGTGNRVRTPMYTIWTEHMCGDLGPPCLVPMPADVEER